MAEQQNQQEPPQQPDPADQTSMGFGSGDEEDMPPEMKEHMLAAFAHKAGLGPHPGMYKGPPRRKHDDEPTDTDMQRAAEEPLEDEGESRHEASYAKMQAARTGGSGLGPPEMDVQEIKQSQALQQQAATMGAVQAQKAQAAQSPVPAPPAPSSAVGTSVPYQAQRREQEGDEQPPQGSQQPPPAPGPPGS